MKLKDRGGVWYAEGKIGGRLYRESTGFKVDGGKAHKEAGKRRMAEIELEIRSRQYGWSTDCPTFSEWWQTYRTTHEVEKGTRTQTRDAQMMVPALAFFGRMRLDEIRKSDCLKYLQRRREAPHANLGHKSLGVIAEGTVQRERSLIQAVIQQAVEDGHLTKNPWRGIERVPYAVRDRVVTEEEQAVLLSRLSPRFQRFVIVMLGTGLRLDELRHVDPKTHIDWASRHVRVTRKGGKVQDVPFPVGLVPILKAQIVADGKLWDQNPQRFREVLARACREKKDAHGHVTRAGLPHISPHTLRHTFGWRWLKAGGDIYKLSKILGHASVGVTERHYAHLLKEDLRAAVDVIGAAGLGLVAV